MGGGIIQYQKVVSNDDITHCSHGKPCGPNCGGLYPSARAVGTTCSCTYGELHVLLMKTMRLAKRHRNLTLAFYERRDFASQPPRTVELLYYRRAGMSRRIQAERASCVHMCQHSERTVVTPHPSGNRRTSRRVYSIKTATPGGKMVVARPCSWLRETRASRTTILVEMQGRAMSSLGHVNT